MKHIIGFLAMLLPLLSGAQVPAVKALSIGDTVPDIVFSHVINYKHPTARLSDFKGKLVILDFWASWCTTCLKGFPHSDSLQKQFNNRLQILLVNPEVSRDSLKEVSRVLAQLQKVTGSKLRIPIVVYDTTAYAYFPFHELPNCVWIEDGKVVAISGGEEVTAQNIDAFLQGRDPCIPLKKDDPRYQ